MKLGVTPFINRCASVSVCHQMWLIIFTSPLLLHPEHFINVFTLFSNAHQSRPLCLPTFFYTLPLEQTLLFLSQPLFQVCLLTTCFVVGSGGKNTLCAFCSFWLPWCLWSCSFCSIDLNVKWKNQYYYRTEKRACYTRTVFWLLSDSAKNGPWKASIFLSTCSNKNTH